MFGRRKTPKMNKAWGEKFRESMHSTCEICNSTVDSMHLYEHTQLHHQLNHIPPPSIDEDNQDYEVGYGDGREGVRLDPLFEDNKDYALGHADGKGDKELAEQIKE